MYLPPILKPVSKIVQRTPKKKANASTAGNEDGMWLKPQAGPGQDEHRRGER